MTPGEGDFAQSELRLAREALRAGRLLVEQQLPASAASRLYYAVFHAARAALVVQGIHSKTHTGQADLFQQTYGRTPLVRGLMEQRWAADYGKKAYEPAPGLLERLATEAADFVERCESIVGSMKPDEPDPPPDL